MSNETPINPTDLDMDLSQYDTSLPLLAPNKYDLVCAAAEIKNDDDGIPSLRLTLKTTAPAFSVEGETLEAGTPAFTRIYLRPKKKMTMEQVKRGVASLIQAAQLQGCGLGNADKWHKQLEGRIIPFKVTVSKESMNKETGEIYEPRNNFNPVPPRLSK